jgi:MFS family permease
MTIDWYPWVVVAHVIAAFAFTLAHGVSAFVSFRLRAERRPEHVATLIGLSSMSLSVMYPALLALLVAGIVGGFMGDWWGHAWIWLSIGLLLAIATAMYLVGTRHYIAVRHAVGISAPQDGKDAPAPTPASPEELDALLTSRRPEWLALIGGAGLAAIIWLMEVKP